MPDGKTWIYGNNGNSAMWSSLFTNATNVNGHDATLISGKCPSGYSAPTKAIYGDLINSTTYATLYANFGRDGSFWSSTEEGQWTAYTLWGASKTNWYYMSESKSSSFPLLCYK